MAKGFCSVCKTQLGGLGKPKGFICPSCKKMFCINCSPKRGLLKWPYCPDCGVKLNK